MNRSPARRAPPRHQAGELPQSAQRTFQEEGLREAGRLLRIRAHREAVRLGYDVVGLVFVAAVALMTIIALAIALANGLFLGYVLPAGGLATAAGGIRIWWSRGRS